MQHECGGRSQNRLGIGKLNIRKPGFYSDGGNLYLQVDESEDGVLRRSWIFRYKLRGVIVKGTWNSGRVFCPAPDGTKLAADFRESVATGTDPIEHRRTTQAETLRAGQSRASMKSQRNTSSRIGPDGAAPSMVSNGFRRWQPMPLRCWASCRLI